MEADPKNWPGHRHSISSFGKFDLVNNVTINSSRQKKPNAVNDILVVVNELVKSKCFAAQVEGRKHFAFPKPKNVLNAKDPQELLEWHVGKLPRSL